MIKTLVEKDNYFDSVYLMSINSSIKKMDGVINAVVSMGTEMNIELLKDLGYDSDDLLTVTPNDLLVVIEAEKEEEVTAAVSGVYDLINRKKKRGVGDSSLPKSLTSAINAEPGANLVIISLPGEFAAREATKALDNGLNVMMFSDNVSVEDEISLKKLAVEKGLLMMGPDCGTAIINGYPLCFANAVRRGRIGIVGASGTGIQEVTCCIDALGGGISQALGTGGRDLKEPRIGGEMMVMGIEALKNDPETDVIVVISKPPVKIVAEKVISALEETGKPVVVHFIGNTSRRDSKNLHFAANLEESAKISVALSRGETYTPSVFTMPEAKINKIITREAKNMSSCQKYIRGIYTGGTVADEALILFEKHIGPVYSNSQKNKELQLNDSSVGHTVIDLGDDIYTVGRPHPMIDPGSRIDRIKKEGDDKTTALLLLDIVLGYGSHPDPAGVIIESIIEARKKVLERGGYLPVITSVIGTEKDFQGWESTTNRLRSAGCVVMPSNYQAVMLALEILKRAGGS